MDQIITGLVDRLLVPFIDGVVVPVVTDGIGFLIFAVIWGAFAYRHPSLRDRSAPPAVALALGRHG